MRNLPEYFSKDHLTDQVRMIRDVYGITVTNNTITFVVGSTTYMMIVGVRFFCTIRITSSNKDYLLNFRDVEAYSHLDEIIKITQQDCAHEEMCAILLNIEGITINNYMMRRKEY